MAIQEEGGCVGWHKVNPCADLPHTPAQGIGSTKAYKPFDCAEGKH